MLTYGLDCLGLILPSRYTILDEADEMIQPDWEEEMKSILGGAGETAFSVELLLLTPWE